MVWIPPPQLAGDGQSYLHMYNKIISDHRRAVLPSAAAVIMLVAPNVDALCASRMLATLFKQDDTGYRIIPVSGRIELEKIAVELQSNTDLRNLILIDMGGTYDLPLDMWFGNFDLQVTIHVIDSARPYSLVTLFMGGPFGERIIVWDDGSCQDLNEEKTSWEIIEYEPAPESDDEDQDDIDDEEEFSDIGNEDDPDLALRKRRRDEGDSARKRPRIQEDGGRKITSDEWDFHQQRINKYYTSGTSYGQCAACTIYILATQLERVDNDLLWFAILGLTYKYINSKISRAVYENYQGIYHDEVSRLSPQAAQNDVFHSFLSINPDDISVRSTEELRFMLCRHWTLYDAMLHSSYVAGKLGIWKEKGRSRLTGLLAKMGLSINQAQQPYSHMDMDLKKNLIQKLDEIAPEYGLVELSYPSFIRCYGFHTQPLSAADAVEGISALLDAADGIRIEVEIEGTRNGGEWFGGGRVWEAQSSDRSNGIQKTNFDSSAKGIDSLAATKAANDGNTHENESQTQEPDCWVKNFWSAYDALSDISALRRSLNLSMSVHRAIIRTGTSIIDKQEIKTMRSRKVVVLTQGPDLALFVHHGMLTRLALWLIDALRDRMPVVKNGPRSRKGDLPMVLACFNEPKNRFTVVGVTAAPDFGEVYRNHFSLAFYQAINQCGLDAQFGSFDASVIEIDKKDLKVFLDTVCQS